MTRIARKAAVERRPGSDDESEGSSSQSLSGADQLDQQIATLSSLGVADLRKAWAERFRRPAPPIQSADLLLRLFAWKLQVTSFGDLDADTSSKLARLKTALTRGKSTAPSPALGLRRRGIFMGGNPPLGYDPKDRKLIVNEQEAETVRFIFNRYLELKSVGKLRADLEQKSIRSKLWTSAKGNTKGGGSWYVGSLTHFLRNRVYVGDAVHKDEVFPGEHEPIISRELFDQVQSQLDTNRVNYRKKTTIESANLLTGLIFDDRGNSMSPKTARKPGNKAYTYYVSQAQIQQRDTNIKPMRPLAAQMIEGLVRDRLLGILTALDITMVNQLSDNDTGQSTGSPKDLRNRNWEKT